MSDSNEKSPLGFPCLFPIKVMGRSDIEFDLLVIDIVRRHAPNLYPNSVTTKASKAGNFISVTLVIEADSKAQLDAIYQDLTDHPQVLMAL